jgi:adenosylcobinamide kinase/adenosylcobinamide-phosphate guanylyltransferase
MKLVIGGAYQGKLSYASEKYGITEWTDGRSCSFDDIFCCSGIHHFHEYVRRALEEDRDLTELDRELEEKNKELVIVSNELGYGVVPVDAFDRRFREAHGRICCRLAAASDEVSRVICGIGTVIRHA